MSRARPAGKLFIDGPGMQEVLVNAKAILRGRDVSKEILKQVEDEKRLKNDALTLANKIRQAHPRVRPPKTFEDVKDRIDIARALEAVCGVKLETHAVNQFLLAQEQYPSIRARINAHVFITWKALSVSEWQGKRLIPDIKHLTEACYADVFVTSDEEAAKATPLILGDHVRVLSVADFIKLRGSASNR